MKPYLASTNSFCSLNCMHVRASSTHHISWIRYNTYQDIIYYYLLLKTFPVQVCQDLRQTVLSAGAVFWRGELGTAVKGTAVSTQCYPVIPFFRSPPVTEFSSFTSAFCLWSVFLGFSCKAYLFPGRKSSLQNVRDFVLLLVHCLCFAPINYSSGNNLSSTLNLTEEGIWVN